MGEVFIKPLSALRVRLPLTLTSQLGSCPLAKVIQQQLEYLNIEKKKKPVVPAIFKITSMFAKKCSIITFDSYFP